MNNHFELCFLTFTFNMKATSSNKIFNRKEIFTKGIHIESIVLNRLIDR